MSHPSHPSELTVPPALFSYTLFWIGLFLVGLKTVIKSFQETGYPLSGNFYRLISGDGLVLAMSDAVLVGASYLCVPFVKAIERGWFRYHWTGVVLQHIGQTAYLAVAGELGGTRRVETVV